METESVPTSTLVQNIEFILWTARKGAVGEGPHVFFSPFLSPFIFCGQRLQPTIVLVVPSTAFSKHGLM